MIGDDGTLELRNTMAGSAPTSEKGIRDGAITRASGRRQPARCTRMTRTGTSRVGRLVARSTHERQG
jgi:hypothetical protein